MSRRNPVEGSATDPRGAIHFLRARLPAALLLSLRPPTIPQHEHEQPLSISLGIFLERERVIAPQPGRQSTSACPQFRVIARFILEPAQGIQGIPQARARLMSRASAWRSPSPLPGGNKPGHVLRSPVRGRTPPAPSRQRGSCSALRRACDQPPQLQPAAASHLGLHPRYPAPGMVSWTARMG